MKYVHIYDDSHFEEDRDYVGVGVWAMIIFSVCVVFYYFYEYWFRKYGKSLVKPKYEKCFDLIQICEYMNTWILY